MKLSLFGSFTVVIVSGMAVMFSESWALGQDPSENDKPGFGRFYLIGGSRSVGWGVSHSKYKGPYGGIEMVWNPSPNPPSEFESETEINFPIGYSFPLSSRVTLTPYGLLGYAMSSKCIDRVPGSCRIFMPDEYPEHRFSDGLLDYREATHFNGGGGMEFAFRGKKHGFSIGVRATRRSGFSMIFGITF